MLQRTHSSVCLSDLYTNKSVKYFLLGVYAVAMRYELEGSELDSRWCRWKFSLA